MTRVTNFWRTVLSAKVMLAFVVLSFVLGAAFNLDQFRSAYARWPAGEEPELASRFSTWDIAHYLRLSQGGYEAGSHSCAFYPLWPAALRIAIVLTGGRPVLASILLTNALSLVALWLFYRLVERRYGEATGRDALIMLLAFPGALFLSFAYTESFYLVILLVFFRALESDRYFWACMTAFLLPLARPVGVFILLPLAWHLYERRRSIKHWPMLAVPLLGYACYFGVIYLWTGNAFEGFEAQKSYPNSPSIKNMFNVAGFTAAFANVGTLDGMMDSALDRGFFLLVLALLPLVYRLDKTWFWYTLPAGVVPALTSWFMSYRRYVIVLFPIFIVLTQLAAKSKSRWLFWYYVAFMAALQVWAIKQFVNFNWAG